MSSERIARLALAATLLLVIGVRIHRLDVPLERDEGEFAYMGQLILQGVPPFEAAYNMKLPGTHYAYAAIMALGGDSVEAIHLGLLGLNLAAIGLVYVLARRLLGRAEAALSALCYAVLSLEPTVQGFSAHATHFILVPALGGLLVLLHALAARRRGLIFVAGFLLGVAFLMKQHGIAFVALGLLCLCWTLAAAGAGWRGVAFGSLLFVCGAALPLAVVGIHLAWEGVFSTFWHWTFEYAQHYVSLRPPRQAATELSQTLGPIVRTTWPFWLCAAVGTVEVAANRRRRASRGFLAGLLLFSVGAVLPGFYFRPHYFIPLLPAVSLLCAVGLVRVARFAAAPLRTGESLILLVLTGAILLAWAYQRAPFLFSFTAEGVSHAIYKDEFFPECRAIGEFLGENSEPDDTIAVLGSEPEIYFYARRRAASGFLYTYALMEPQPFAFAMQRQMAAEIERAQPRYLVFMKARNSWGRKPGSDLFILRWGEVFRRTYRPVGLYELRPAGRSRFLLGEDARDHEPPWALVYERASESLGGAPPAW